MNLAASILGTSTVEKLRESAGKAVLVVGSDKLTRKDLARVECYNYLAARNLTEILKQLDGVRNLRDVYEKVPPSALALPHMGVVSLAVLGAAFEARGIGGDTPLESYVRKHNTRKNGEDHIVTFYTIKHREQKEAAEERKARKRRKSQRRDQAHKIRSDRFEERQQQEAGT